MSGCHDERHECLPHGNKRYDNEWEEHLEVVYSREGEPAQDEELEELQEGEGVDSSLGHLGRERGLERGTIWVDFYPVFFSSHYVMFN